MLYRIRRGVAPAHDVAPGSRCCPGSRCRAAQPLSDGPLVQELRGDDQVLQPPGVLLPLPAGQPHHHQRHVSLHRHQAAGLVHRYTSCHVCVSVCHVISICLSCVCICLSRVCISVSHVMCICLSRVCTCQSRVYLSVTCVYLSVTCVHICLSCVCIYLSQCLSRLSVFE